MAHSLCVDVEVCLDQRSIIWVCSVLPNFNLRGCLLKSSRGWMKDMDDGGYGDRSAAGAVISRMFMSAVPGEGVGAAIPRCSRNDVAVCFALL